MRAGLFALVWLKVLADTSAMVATAKDIWIAPRQVFDGVHLREGGFARVAEGHIAEIVDQLPPGISAVSLPGLLSPGFIDLQVNGGGGVLFNETPTPEGITTIIAAHRDVGTAAILPTVITDAPEVLARAVEAVIRAWGLSGLAGIHIEGPHIAKARRGTHAAEFISDMDSETIAHVERLRDAGIPVMITLAPEAATSNQVAALAETGAIVSIGHSDADAETTRAALGAGATCFTHLFNAMPPMLSRAPGVAGAAINSNAYAGIICDGVHVADEMIGLAIRARPLPDRMFVVSDAMPTLGGPDRFRLYGRDVRLKDGRLVNEEGTLAGAHISMMQSVARLIENIGITPEAALRMAVTVPASLMNIGDQARLVGRPINSIAVIAPDWTFKGMLDRHL